MTLSVEANSRFASALASADNKSLVDAVSAIVEQLLALKDSWPGESARMDGGARSNLSAAESAMLAKDPSARVVALLAAAVGNELGSLLDRFSSSRPVTEFDISAAEGFLRKVEPGVYALHKSNLSAIANPTVTDDVTQGYGTGSPWANAVDDTYFLCVNATQGQAAWANLSKRAQSEFVFFADSAESSI